MLQHVTSPGSKSACLILILCLCQAKLRPSTAPAASSLCWDMREGHASISPGFGKIRHSGVSELLPAVTGDEEIEATFSTGLGF